MSEKLVGIDNSVLLDANRVGRSLDSIINTGNRNFRLSLRSHALYLPTMLDCRRQNRAIRITDSMYGR